MTRIEPNKRPAWTFLLLALLPGFALLAASYCISSGAPVTDLNAISAAQLERGLRIDGHWQFQPGDDPAWADPGYDDGNWSAKTVPSRWEGGGYPESGQMAWYRLTLQVPEDWLALRGTSSTLAVAIGKVMSAYEVYAGGRLLGGVGSLPPAGEAVYDQQKFYIVPESAIDGQGRLVIALRVWGGSDALVSGWGGGPYSGGFMLGESGGLMLRGIVKGIPSLLFCTLILAFGAHHLLIFLRNRSLPAYLWFGLLALDIAIYGLMLSQWKFLLPVPFVVVKKLEFVAIYLFPALAIQMLWTLIDRPIARWLRVYQSGFLAWVALVALVPGLLIHHYTLTAWQLYTLPVFVLVPWVLVAESYAGNREARTILPAVSLFLLTCLNDLLIDIIFPDGLRLMPLGFIAILMGMSFSMVNRFTRMYNQLEQEVAQRTAELSDANRRLNEAARIDPLTGVLNRRGFTEEAEAEISRMHRNGAGFCVVLADIDFFKRFNDEHGHVCGDHVLKRVADILFERTRDIDQLGRWGGEEFILLLPETESAGAVTLAEKLRDAVEKTDFAFAGQHMHLTMTFGISEFREGDSLDGCIARADTALYHGKKNGRNRVMIGKTSGLSLVN